MQISNVIKNTFRCQKCLNDKIKNEATEANLSLKGPGKDKSYRLYEFHDCGHQQEIQCSDVRRKSFLCSICETSSWTQESYVYLLRIRFNKSQWLKLGYAKNIDSRISRYGLPENAMIEVLKKKKIKTGKDANKLERHIHNKYSNEKINSNHMERYHTKSGWHRMLPIGYDRKIIRQYGNIF